MVRFCQFYDKNKKVYRLNHRNLFKTENFSAKFFFGDEMVFSWGIKAVGRLTAITIQNTFELDCIERTFHSDAYQ